MNKLSHWVRNWPFGIFLLPLFCILAAGCGEPRQPQRPPIEISRGGEAALRIVLADDHTQTEAFAAEELRTYLSKVAGAGFEIVGEAAAGEEPGIYLGWTRRAREQNLPLEQLGKEEWVVRTTNRDLILTGGRPRGTLYAVYEFLEKQVGCHWLDAHIEVVPERPDLAVGPLDLQGSPAFWYRQVHNPRGTDRDQWLFMVRNKNYRHDQPGFFPAVDESFPSDTFHQWIGTPRSPHTFSDFVNANDWFETHPEYFSLVNGERLPAIDAMGPGQLCLTHPDVRRITIGKLREFIEQDRQAARESGAPYPTVYNIMQNDKYNTHCQCETCSALVAQQESESGPMVDFVNAVAEALGEEYPDLLFATLAYNLTRSPPKSLKPRENVLILWCDVYSRSDHLRPLAHPLNVIQSRDLIGWSGIAGGGLGIHDYWNTLSIHNHMPLPYTLAHTIPADLRLLADNGYDYFESESADYLEPARNFLELEFWLAFKLLDDPYQLLEPLLDTFFDSYYGAAAPALRRYYDYLTGRMVREAQYMGYRYVPFDLAYLDLDFFINAQALLEEAEELVEPATRQHKNVLRERFTVDSALLVLWPWLERKLQPGERIPFDHEELVRRFESGWKNYDANWFNTWYRAGHSHNKDGNNLDRTLDLFRNRGQVPADFAQYSTGQTVSFDWSTFSLVRPSQKLVPDEDAFGGMAVEAAAPSAVALAEEDGGALSAAAVEMADLNAIPIGADGGPELKIPRQTIPADGKFHLYPLGAVEIQPTILPEPGSEMILPKWGTMVWALEGKRLGVFVDRIYQENASQPEANLWDAWISLKFDGPDFVPGSTGDNVVRMDRVLLAKPRQPEKED